MKRNNRIELKNIGNDHSADIDCNDFMKIYRKCTKKPFNFLTIDTTLPASDLLFIYYLFISSLKDTKIQYNI